MKIWQVFLLFAFFGLIASGEKNFNEEKLDKVEKLNNNLDYNRQKRGITNVICRRWCYRSRSGWTWARPRRCRYLRNRKKRRTCLECRYRGGCNNNMVAMSAPPQVTNSISKLHLYLHLNVSSI